MVYLEILTKYERSGTQFWLPYQKYVLIQLAVMRGTETYRLDLFQVKKWD